VILTSIVTLAFAMSSANDATDDTSLKQAQVRYATLRISELIRHCKLICGTPNNDLAIWREDANDIGQININEIVFIERGMDRNLLRLCEFPSSDTTQVNLSQIQTLSPDDYSVRRVTLIPQCSNVQFNLYITPPYSATPYAKFVSILFELVEDNAVHQYQINAALGGWAGNLLKDGEIVSQDDD
jgi:hypothetical protein